jgi:hypothetical protein
VTGHFSLKGTINTSSDIVEIGETPEVAIWDKELPAKVKSGLKR